MSSYDIFVLVVAVVVFYFIFRIVAKILRGAKKVVNTAQNIAARHQEKHVEERPIVTPPPRTEPVANTPQKTNTIIEDAQAVERCSDIQVQAGLAEAIIRSNDMLWQGLANHYDVEGKRGHIDLTLVCFLIQVTDHFSLGKNETVINGMIKRICEMDDSYKDYVLNMVWPQVWNIYMEYKATESQPGTAVAQLFVRNLAPITGPGVHKELYEFLGLLIKKFTEEIDEVLA